MSPFSQWPYDHVGSAGQRYQNCPCIQCRNYFQMMNDNLRASVRAKPQHLWTAEEQQYMANLQNVQ